SFALPLRSLTGVLNHADKTLLRIDQPSLNSVPAGETARITVRVKLDSAAALKAMTEALASRGRLRFKGNLSIDPPVALHEMLLEGLAKDD
ncbi:hypothetical protein LCGC14_2161250, partial [marine sediment metagenome]